ncbi:MAG: hypothetical protein KAG20_08740, partial [Cocleimonas sp.]|nr:hypothetical protein [Cocleimonas sp.]
MNLPLKILLLGGITLLFLNACQNKHPITSASSPLPTGAYTECKDPRPDLCTEEFRPVCGKVDTGVRCVTTPCPSTEHKTYANACKACTDPKVYGFWKTLCP